MKTLFAGIIMLSAMLMMSCSSKDGKSENAASDSLAITENVAKVQVIYFHGTRRCPSCIAIGDESLKMVNENYSAQAKENLIAFREINVDEEQNLKIAEKYEIAGSALLVIKTVDGKEEITDLTGDGFKLALNMPDMFREKLKAAIDNFLK